MKKLELTHPNEPVNPITHAMHHSTGLTKREYFAIHIMASLLTTKLSGNLDDFAKAAINGADALIESFNNPEVKKEKQDDKNN